MKNREKREEEFLRDAGWKKIKGKWSKGWSKDKAILIERYWMDGSVWGDVKKHLLIKERLEERIKELEEE